MRLTKPVRVHTRWYFSRTTSVKQMSMKYTRNPNTKLSTPRPALATPSEMNETINQGATIKKTVAIASTSPANCADSGRSCRKGSFSGVISLSTVGYCRWLLVTVMIIQQFGQTPRTLERRACLDTHRPWQSHNSVATYRTAKAVVPPALTVFTSCGKPRTGNGVS